MGNGVKRLDSVQKQAGGLDRSDTALILRSHSLSTSARQAAEQSDGSPT